MYSVYTVEKISECTDITLEILVSVNINWSLRVLTSMSIAILLEGSWKLVQVFRSKEKDVFTEILLDATIWDGGKKERSNTQHYKRERK